MIENKIKYCFKDKSLLDLALTHGSYITKNSNYSNERLEFLGDAVLEISVSKYLYLTYSDMNEGDLSRFRSKIVCEASLASTARRIDLGSVLKLGHGESSTGGRDKNSILSDALEALFGAIFLDSNLETAEKIIIDLLQHTEGVFEKKDIIDPKSHLQEILQSTGNSSIIYKIVKESGPAHKKNYVAQVIYMNKVLGEGSGKTKKEAEQYAASQAITKMRYT
jgi:ribonuclease-3